MKLYGYFRSSASYRVRIALHLKEIPFENISVHLVQDGGQQHSENYKKLNPMEQVPTLVDGDFKLSQSLAILQYLDEKHSLPQLFPKNSKDKARVWQVCELINSGLQPLQNLSLLQFIQREHQLDPNKWSHHWIEKGLKALESTLQNTAGNFCFGGTVTAADACLIPQVYNAHRFNVNMSSLPIIKNIYTHCEELEAFQKAHPANQPDAP